MGIYIQLGEDVDLGIVDSDHSDCHDQLVVKQTTIEHGEWFTVVLPLGNATKKRISTLQGYLEQLKIHCPDE